ncbi:MAG: transcriptional repressor [Deltaproteobacteria bacterium]|nr:transcriptional repressor [Deltaproteobacteria bacterium]
MTHQNDLEKANFKFLLEGEGLDRIQDRLKVIDVFMGTKAHITLEEILDLLREAGHNLDPMFVTNCMNWMVEWGFAQKKQFEEQPIRYEHRHLGKHHDHLICAKCGKIVEFRDETIERRQLEVAAAHGFHMLQHRLDIYGLCSDCLSKRQRFLPLAAARSGERVVIREIAGGRTRRARLASMGLRPGDVIEVISNSGEGRLILGHGHARLAVGRGFAQVIMVALDEDAQA